MKRMQRANQRTKQTIDSGIYWDYLYVDAGQLYSALGYTSGGSPITSWNRGYAYDPAWNMTAKTNNTTLNSYVVNNLNQVTNSPAGDHTFDGNGNMTAEAPGTSTARHFTYDDENQLMEVIKYASFSPSTKAEFVYDGKMRLRITREFTYYSGDWLAAGETRYLYDGMLAVQDRDSSNVPTVTYTRGPDLSGTFQGAGGIGGMLARSHGYSTFNGEWSTHNHYFADGNGNITYLVDGSQVRAALYRYDPFGNNLTTIGTIAATNHYRFSSKLIHAPSTLYYYGYRFYNPNLQRWLNADPIGEAGGMNLYRFALNAPVQVVDREGRAGWIPTTDPRQGNPTAFPDVGCPLRVGKAASQKYLQAHGTRYTHCMASCEIAKECGKGVSKAAGWAKEMADLVRCLMSHSPDYCYSAFQPSDEADNKQGRDCPPDESCEDRCKDLKGAPEAPPGPWNPVAEHPIEWDVGMF